MDFIPGYRYKCDLGILKITDNSMSFQPSIGLGSQISALISSGIKTDFMKKLLLRDVNELANYILKMDPKLEKFTKSDMDYRMKFMAGLTASVPAGHHQWSSVGPIETHNPPQ